VKDQLLLQVEELEERIAPSVLGGGHPAQTANPRERRTQSGALSLREAIIISPPLN